MCGTLGTLRHGLDEGFQDGRVSLPQHAGCHAPLLVQDHGGGHCLSGYVFAEREKNLARNVFEGGVGDVEAALEGFRGVLLVAHVHAVKGDFIFEFFGEFLQVGCFGAAGGASGVPEVQQYRFTAQGFGGYGFSVEEFAGEGDRVTAFGFLVFGDGTIARDIAFVITRICLFR